MHIYGLLVTAAETGVMLDAGGLNDQPSWWVDLLGWFLPMYSDNRFYARAMSLLGDAKKSGVVK